MQLLTNDGEKLSEVHLILSRDYYVSTEGNEELKASRVVFKDGSNDTTFNLVLSTQNACGSLIIMLTDILSRLAEMRGEDLIDLEELKKKILGEDG